MSTSGVCCGCGGFAGWCRDAATVRQSRRGLDGFVDKDVHPPTIDVIRTRALPLGYYVLVGDPSHDLEADTVFGVLLQYPGTHGEIPDIAPIIATAHEAGALVAVATDLMALSLITPPGELGADVAIGSSQRFGVPMMFGGPHAGFMATRTKYQRSLPGRLVGGRAV